MTAVVLAGCSDDTGVVGDSSGTDASTGSDTSGAPSTSSGSGTVGQTSTSADDSSTTNDVTSSSTAGDTSTSTSSESTTGEPVDPFGEPVAIDLGDALALLSLEIGDFDGDAAIDLLAVGTSGGTVAATVSFGDGSGGFAAPADAGITACSAFPIVGTIDDDPSADLFFGTCTADLVFWRGQPRGTFVAASPLAPWVAAPIVASRFADQGGDGTDDLVLLTTAEGNQLHLATREDPGPWPVTSASFDLPDFGANRLRVGDVDGDDAVDAVLVDVGDAVVVVEDAFDNPTADEIEIAVVPWNADLADLDGDGVSDLLVSSVEDVAVQLLLGDGAGGFASLAVADLVDVAPFDVAFGDFDGDGRLDVAAVDDDAPVIAYALGTDDGLGPWSTRALSGIAVRVHAVDLDGNGTDDLIAAALGDHTVDVLLSQ